MKAKSRRRLLISSVAMLLVAMLALGTATFAWFSSSTTATATGINVQTEKASNLQISKTSSTEGFGSSVDFGVAETLEPASIANALSGTWFTATAKTIDGQVADPDTVVASATENTNYVSKNFWLKYSNNDDEATLAVKWTLTVTPTESNDADFIRVALINVTDNAIVATYENGADSNFPIKSFNAETKAITYATAADNSAAKLGTAATGDLTTLTANVVKQFRVIVWYEGTDADCTDTNAVTTNDISLKFEKK